MSSPEQGAFSSIIANGTKPELKQLSNAINKEMLTISNQIHAMLRRGEYDHAEFSIKVQELDFLGERLEQTSRKITEMIHQSRTRGRRGGGRRKGSRRTKK